jgi:hypothetical protein
MSALSRHFRAQPPPRPPWRDRAGPVLRGLWAVLVLMLTAVDELVTALIGLAPLTPRLRELAQVIANEYRTGAAGVVSTDVFDDVVDADDDGGK